MAWNYDGSPMHTPAGRRQWREKGKKIEQRGPKYPTLAQWSIEHRLRAAIGAWWELEVTKMTAGEQARWKEIAGWLRDQGRGMQEALGAGERSEEA